MIKAAIFDVDGTLVDSVDLHARAWCDALRDFGREVPFDAVRAQIGKGSDQLMPVFLPPEEVQARGEALAKHRSAIFKDRYLSQVRPLPGALDLIKRTDAAGLRVALASSAKGEELAAYKRILGVEDDHLDAETSADDAERSKPFPDIFEAALARLGGQVAPEEAVAIGDTPYDAEAAGKAGLRTIGVLSGGFPEEALRAAGCVAIYRDPAHLLEEFEDSPLGGGQAND